MQYNFYIGLGSILYLFFDLLIITVYDHQVMNKAIIIGLFIFCFFTIRQIYNSCINQMLLMCK